MAPKKRLAILAALDCFSETGFDGTSTKMIAQRAGIGEATIFRHFPTKRDLLLRLAAPVIRHILTPAAEQQAVALLDQHRDEPRLILREVMLSRLAFMTHYEPLVRILFQEALVNRELRDLIVAEATPLFQQLTEVVGIMGPVTPTDRERFFRTVGSLIAGYFIHRSILQPERDWDDAAEVDGMLAILFDGIGPKG
ncbi:TetR/AcrR family transcriptional regulator [Maritimibacter sp. UBA3975]|uniref:TetR/AcrR family transcriptional regulator n=1 Tax=Maritimibacter sp. UBA3975 TaxID=1946833 RepID=UPI0025BCD871|nr:TetR/AcrR family transcriptional regulator [Maritimibacter sp. UBA3975]